MRFDEPLFLLLLLPPAAALLLRWRRGRRRAPPVYLAFPAVPFLDRRTAGPRARWRKLPGFLRGAGLCLLVVALARPQMPGVSDSTVRARNIVLTLDISSSMKAADFQPGNRLEVAKNVLSDFIRRRHGDLIGLVIFAGSAFTQVPLTIDTGVLLEMLRRVDLGMLPDGTAIGTALATSLTHVKDMPASSAVVLITDGVNNRGEPEPLTAAEAARALGIRVYTIGVSTAGAAAYTAERAGVDQAWREKDVLRGRRYGAVPSGVDEEMLREISQMTGGRYFRAAEPRALARIMDEIDRLEKTNLRVRQVRDYDEVYASLVGPALALLVIELLLRALWLRRLP